MNIFTIVFFIPTSTVKELQFYIFTSGWYWIFSFLVGMSCYLIKILIYIFLIANAIEHLSKF